MNHTPLLQVNDLSQMWAKYSGDLVDGKKQGHGRLDFPDNRVYVGSFVDDRFEGSGVFTWPDGGRFEGEFKNGMFNGKGEFICIT